MMMMMMMGDETMLVESYARVMLYQGLAENVVVYAKSQTKIHIPLQTCSQSCQGSQL